MERFLYLIGANENPPVKIGIANKPPKRLKGIQTGNPNHLIIHYKLSIPYENCQHFERIVHYQLKRYRLKGEWFDTTPQHAKETIDFLLMHLDLNQSLRPYLPGGIYAHLLI